METSKNTPRTKTTTSSSARLRTLTNHMKAKFAPVHVSSTTGGASAGVDADGTENNGNATPMPRRMLTTAQLQSFIQKGFVSVNVRDDLGVDWIASFYDRCRQHAQSQSKVPLFRQLSAEVNELLDCPSVAGGLVSLLGPDYLIAPGEFVNDGLKLHQARPPGHDQGFHRDGTDHVTARCVAATVPDAF